MPSHGLLNLARPRARRPGDPSEESLLQQRSSFDTFVVAHRTRYPSNQIRPPQATELDLRVASSLLDGSSHQQYNGPHESDRRNTTPERSCPEEISRRFAASHNDIGRELGLSELSIGYDKSTAQETLRENEKYPSKSWLMQRLSRKTSANSFKTDRAWVRRRQSSLDDFCRVGGLSILQLPTLYSSVPLLVPACLAATGNYLIKHGCKTPGIFRIPGQTGVVNALYTYYSNQMFSAEATSESIDITIGSCELPARILPDIHDVASVFKRFLRDIPGGVLGSLKLFQALKEIRDTFLGANAKLTAQLVALRLLSLDSDTRFTLICAVFGLLAFLKQDNNGLDCTEISCPDGMSSNALAVVFAPLLLGDATESIEIDTRDLPTGSTSQVLHVKKLLRYWKPSKASKAHKEHKEECNPVMAASLDKYRMAVLVAEMLIDEWEAITQHLKALSRFPRPSLPLTLDESSSRVEPTLTKLGKIPTSNGKTSRPAHRSGSLSKSASQPILGTSLAELGLSVHADILKRRTHLTRSVSECLEPVCEISSPIVLGRRSARHPTTPVEVEPGSIGNAEHIVQQSHEKTYDQDHCRELTFDTIVTTTVSHKTSPVPLHTQTLAESLEATPEPFAFSDTKSTVPHILDTMNDWAVVHYTRSTDRTASSPGSNNHSEGKGAERGNKYTNNQHTPSQTLPTANSKLHRNDISHLYPQMQVSLSVSPRRRRIDGSHESRSTTSHIPRPVQAHGYERRYIENQRAVMSSEEPNCGPQRRKRNSSNYTSEESLWQGPSDKSAVALFQENQRLHTIIITQREELVQLHRELAAVRQCRDTATLERLRETEMQLDHCKKELTHFRKLMYRGASSDF